MNESFPAALVVFPKTGDTDPGAPRRVDILMALERLRVASNGKFDYAPPASSRDGTWIVEVRL